VSITPTAHIYHRQLDPHGEDSLAKIARLVRPGTQVLDLGAGPGVLGRYLTETLGCLVDGVEYNPAAVAEAAQWYRRLECADLEQPPLAVHFPTSQYDFIICADILEHLRRPGDLLAQLPGLLAPAGQVVLSVPNVAYAGLIAELLAGDLRYRPEGLLDDTHLRFFTRASLLRLLEVHGLRSVTMDATVMPLEWSEFAAAWAKEGWAERQSPEVIRILLGRPEALIYQFIVTAIASAAVGHDSEEAPPTTSAAAQAALTTWLARLSQPPRCSLSVAIVTYAPDLPLLTHVLERLAHALAHARQQGNLGAVQLMLVDNGPGTHWHQPLQNLLDSIQLAEVETELLSGHGNVGYGSGHNRALQRSQADIHLILNPDVFVAENALTEGLAFLAAHHEVGLLAPAAQNEAGETQYLCKNYPSILELGLRGFAPAWLRRRFRARLARYELQDRIDENVLWDPPITSGCFMLCRRQVLAQIGGFRPDYFLYFEDFDLSLRLAAVARLAWVPQVQITHRGGYAARKGIKHISLFMRSALRFFQCHGWRWW
jgi:GT2 family glycosyltransferase/2-polyprenyl-3-methyl-5-hydroxy-6-metoxy-1,4-benzoquinol methylase